jgi:hypothetical protein
MAECEHGGTQKAFRHPSYGYPRAYAQRCVKLRPKYIF